MRRTRIRLHLLTAIIGVGILITWAQTEAIIQGDLSAGVQLGMALAAVGVSLTIGGQVTRRRPER